MAAIVKSYKIKLPYHTYIDVTQCVDGSNLNMLTKPCFKIDGTVEDKSEEDLQIKASFSINPNFKDLCETLDQQVNYVLKVKAECITNQGILSCLQCIENPQAINLILRLTVHQVKAY
ncbi:uncharacterized protein LOC131938180 [Physella acuta]|uniref:uncharacterized protein LOC131938180 n=1 Tax=Physella acuta TaxID=109671 RepID=UPI0027DE830F|nr:uncharacterized protein LOC131938180 [Physella acuta]